MTSRAMSRRAFVGAGISAAATALAGCGMTNPEQAAQPSGEALETLTFCLDYTPNTNHTGVYVAQNRGYFEDEGLEVKIVQPAEDTAETMIGTGQAQLGVSYQDYVANALSANNPLAIQAVGAIIQHNTSGIMSRAEDGITSARLMEDHVYATWDMPVEQATIRQVMEADNGDFSKLKMVAYDTDDEVLGLKANMFDCVWVYEGWAVQNAKIQDYDVNYFSFVAMDDVFDFYTPVIAANNDFCAESPDVVKAFMRAVRRGYEDAISDPDGCADILCSAVPELDAGLVRASAAFLAGEYRADAESWGVIDGGRWARYFQWLNDNDLVENQLDVNAGWTNDYLGD